jgi:hypothetical protein
MRAPSRLSMPRLPQPGAAGNLQSRCRLLGDHDIGGLDDRRNTVADLQPKFVNSFVRDRRCQDAAGGRLDDDVRRRCAAMNLNDLALHLIACAEFRRHHPSPLMWTHILRRLPRIGRTGPISTVTKSCLGNKVSACCTKTWRRRTCHSPGSAAAGAGQLAARIGCIYRRRVD